MSDRILGQAQRMVWDQIFAAKAKEDAEPPEDPEQARYRDYSLDMFKPLPESMVWQVVLTILMREQVRADDAEVEEKLKGMRPYQMPMG